MDHRRHASTNMDAPVVLPTSHYRVHRLVVGGVTMARQIDFSGHRVDCSAGIGVVPGEMIESVILWTG